MSIEAEAKRIRKVKLLWWVGSLDLSSNSLYTPMFCTDWDEEALDDDESGGVSGIVE
jgi:hypothetical protein